MDLREFYALSDGEKANISELSLVTISNKGLLSLEEWGFFYSERAKCKALSPEEWDFFYSQLAQCASLKSLSFDGYDLHNISLNFDNWSIFCDAITQCQSLTQLILNNNSLHLLSSPCWIILGEKLAQHRNIVALKLNGNHLGLIESERKWSALQQMLRQCHALKLLDISNNQLTELSPEKWASLEQTLAMYPSLNELHLALNKMNTVSLAQWQAFCRALAQCRFLTKLDLWGIGVHKFTDQYWRILSRTLASYTNLNIVCLSLNEFLRIEHEQSVVLQKRLSQSQPLEELEFTSSNPSSYGFEDVIGPYKSGWLLLEQTLAACRSLKKLAVRMRDIPEDKQNKFMQIIKQLPHIREVILIGDATELNDFSEALSHHEALTSFSWKNNQLNECTDEQLSILDRTLSSYKILTRLDVSSSLLSELEPRQWELFIQIIGRTSENLEIIYSENNLSTRQVTQISQVLVQRATPLTTTPDGVEIIPSSEIRVDLSTPLGSGGYGTVYKGSFGASAVAIKKLHTQGMTEKALASFREEAKKHHSFRHPNIVILYGICFGPGQYYMVMAQMSCSLRDLLLDDTPLSLLQRYEIANGIIDGIIYLHAKGVIHRDLKSSNILIDIDKGYHPYLADFGLSEVKPKTDAENPLRSNSSPGVVVGSLRWMAPELFKNWPCSVLTDIFAYGVVLWEIITNQLPFPNASNQEVIALIRDGQREAIPPRKAPQAYRNLIQGCWQQDPEKRPQQAKPIANTLRLFKAQEQMRADIKKKEQEGRRVSEAELELLSDDPGFRTPGRTYTY
ncbi:MAG: protein kinase [Legionellaceae bacterium]|nr:protein kinase [Legionellaceae bacterium]MBP9775130.1 protein kinase [Legionellaceae bacterium]